MNPCNNPPNRISEHRTNSPQESESLGEQIGRLLHPGDVVLLSGTLGAGKTCLTRGLAHGWGAVEQPTSPTFTLINEYHRSKDGSEVFYHADCYRMENAGDAISAGIEDLFAGDGIIVIEWPERIEALLPEQYLLVEIEADSPDTRRLRITACGEQPSQLLQILQNES